MGLPYLILIVGAQGSGKTTLVKNLEKTYPIYKGLDMDELLDRQPIDEYFKTSVMIIRAETAKYPDKIYVISHIDFNYAELSLYYTILTMVVFTPLALNIVRQIERDKPRVLPNLVRDFYCRFFTADINKGVGEWLEKFKHKDIEKALENAKVMFSDDVELYNWVGDVVTRLDVKYDTPVITTYKRRGVFQSKNIVIRLPKLEDRLKFAHEKIQEWISSLNS